MKQLQITRTTNYHLKIKVKFSNQGPNGSLIQDCNGSVELPIWNQDNSFNIIDCSRKKQAPTEQRKNFFERLFDW